MTEGELVLSFFLLTVLVPQGCQTRGPWTKSGPQPFFELAKNIMFDTIGVIVEYLLSIICPRLLLSDVVIT